VLIDAAVDTGWRQTPILVGDLAGPRGTDGPFVLLSGHHDTWHHGVMDNGGANATMLEVARVCALAHEHWCRGLRVAFWSGHSQGRYSGSAWYADTHWEELDRRAVAHVNVDSTGGRGNTVVSDTSASEELAALAREALAAQAGQEFSGRRTERAGDQSFWGIGVPSIFANMSEQPAGGDVNAMGAVIGAGTRRGAGTGWWWHTPDDTEDKIDGEILLRDTRIYQHAVWRLLATPVPPLDFASAAHAVVETLMRRQQEAGDALDLSNCLDRARALEERAVRLRRAAATAEGADAEQLEDTLRRLSRALVPLAYTRGDRFAHDPALPQSPIPALADASLLDGLDADGRRFLVSRLVREANRVAHALEEALAVLPTE
jgi:Peptidase family M28